MPTGDQTAGMTQCSPPESMLLIATSSSINASRPDALRFSERVERRVLDGHSDPVKGRWGPISARFPRLEAPLQRDDPGTGDIRQISTRSGRTTLRIAAAQESWSGH